MGLLAAQTAMSFGATDVAITDVNAYRLDVARQLGVPAALNVRATTLATAGIEADVLVECSGHPEATRDAIAVLTRAG